MTVPSVSIAPPPVRVAATAPTSAARPAAPAALNTTSNASVPQISKAAELVSKLGQLAQNDPARFKSVTESIARKLGAATTRADELAKRSTLEAELARATQQARASTGETLATTGVSPAGSTAEGPHQTLASAFATASSTGTMSPVGGTIASWTAPSLTAALTVSIALVNEALGLPVT